MSCPDHCVPVDAEVCFHDFLPVMAERMGQDEFMEELRVAFRGLADPGTNTITVESLKRNARFLGLDGMTDQELRDMIMQGDADRDGELNEREFCVMMIRSSPALLAHAEVLLFDALNDELAEYMNEDESF